MCDQQSLRSACAYAQSDQSLCLSLEYYMTIKLLTEHYMEFLRLIGGCRGTSESTLVKIPHCWKSHVTAHIVFAPFPIQHSFLCSFKWMSLLKTIPQPKKILCSLFTYMVFVPLKIYHLICSLIAKTSSPMCNDPSPESQHNV